MVLQGNSCIAGVINTFVLAAGETDACELLLVLVEFLRNDLRVERQLLWLQVKPDCLAHPNSATLRSGSNVASGYSQLLPVPWARGAGSASGAPCGPRFDMLTREEIC